VKRNIFREGAGQDFADLPVSFNRLDVGVAFPNSWPVRRAKCGNAGTVTAAAGDLAANCSAADHAASPAIRAGGRRLHAASAERTQGQPASGSTD
jgi:hypothetical protein